MTTQRTPDAGKTMGDREMLELAALAGGIRHIKYENDYDGSQGLMQCDVHGYHTHTWNPRDDDGDAFRLKVKLQLTAYSCGTYSSVSGTYTADGFEIPDETTVWNQETNGDPFAAERLAITRAAAEAGRAMREAGEHQ